MKINKIVKKDLKLFKRDRKSLVLTIISPIFLMLILALIFHKAPEERFTGGINIGLCNLDDKKLENLGIPLFKFIEMPSPECEEKAESEVSKGKLRASIIIPKDFSENIKEGHGSKIILFVDNSKSQSALVITDSVKALIQEMNEKIGTDFIKNAWESLSELNKNLKIVVENMEIAKAKSISLQEKADELNTELDKINETEIDFYLDVLNSSIGSIKINLTLNLTIDKELQDIQKLYDLNCPLNLTETQCRIINNSINNLGDLNQKLKKSNDKMNSFLQLTNTSSVTNQLEFIRSTKEKTKLGLVNLNNTLYNYTNNIIALSDNLKKTSVLLDIYTTRDPKNIVRAVTLEDLEVFEKRTYFEFLSPGLILIILLFTITLSSSANIVEERKKGTMARTLLSPTKIPTLIISKTVYFLILGIIEFISMLIILFLFSTPISLTPLTIIILALSIINFISLGILIGSVSNSENTALLTALVINLPMFFLSNTFFPLEIMPDFVKIIGYNLPLTLGIQNLDRLITYTSSIDYSSILKLIILPLVLSVLAYLAIKRKPTSE